MPGPIVSRSSTCLSCLRRLAQPFKTSNPVSLIQTRAKSNNLRARDQGVIVRLLTDIPKFGRKDAIFRIERGRMRNEWFPKKQAEYMTTTRFQQLGLSRKNDVGERDSTFVPIVASPDPVLPTTASKQADASPAEIRKPDLNTSPEKAHELLRRFIPDTLTFHRKPIPSPTPKKVSPLIAAESGEDQLAMFGSVSTIDIASHVKSLLAADPQGNRIILEPGQIHFVDMDDNTDKIKTFGHWKVAISVKDSELDPVQKVVEVLPESRRSSQNRADEPVKA
ncbi:hypothetical protein QBC35DRAFT_443610 [Podospora australis]|uniref:Ribosomal protein L9 domain-containing protein n=1 Tax=Podospora australis TaxID=1536484 RepID=A0AAN7AC93_9PEZI|nr:hypothetical protein QBC35DRAFT_443610 [Podospora australis]